MTTRRRGFTLAETLVALALLATAFVSLQQVLSEASASLARSRADERAPQLEAALLQVRQDVHSAAALARTSGAWSEEPLDLVLADGTRIRLSLRRGALRREERGSGIAEAGRSRTLVRPLRSFRWRQPADGLVELQLVAPLPRSSKPGARPASPPATLVAALRGAGRRSASW